MRHTRGVLSCCPRSPSGQQLSLPLLWAMAKLNPQMEWEKIVQPGYVDDYYIRRRFTSPHFQRRTFRTLVLADYEFRVSTFSYITSVTLSQLSINNVSVY